MAAGDEPAHRVGRAAVVLGGVSSEERFADERAAEVPERLGWEQLSVGLDDREPGDLVTAVERQPCQDLAAEVRRSDPVPGEPEPVVGAPSATEDRQVSGRDIDRPAPGVRQSPSAELREEPANADAACAVASGSTSRRSPSGRRPPSATSPAEGDAPVRGRADVVQQRPAVVDVLTADPTDLLDHVGDWLGDDDVARRHRERQAVAGEAGAWRCWLRALQTSPSPCRRGSRRPSAVSLRTALCSCSLTPLSITLARNPSASRAGWTFARSRKRTAEEGSDAQRAATSSALSVADLLRGADGAARLDDARPRHRAVPRSSPPGGRRRGTRHRRSSRRTTCRSPPRHARRRGTPRPQQVAYPVTENRQVVP